MSYFTPRCIFFLQKGKNYAIVNIFPEQLLKTAIHDA